MKMIYEKYEERNKKNLCNLRNLRNLWLPLFHSPRGEARIITNRFFKLYLQGGRIKP